MIVHILEENKLKITFYIHLTLIANIYLKPNLIHPRSWFVSTYVQEQFKLRTKKNASNTFKNSRLMSNSPIFSVYPVTIGDIGIFSSTNTTEQMGLPMRFRKSNFQIMEASLGLVKSSD